MKLQMAHIKLSHSRRFYFVPALCRPVISAIGPEPMAPRWRRCLTRTGTASVAAGTSLKEEVPPRSACGQLLHQLADLVWPVRHGSPMRNLIATRALCNSNGNRCLVDVRPDKRAMFHSVSPPFRRRGASQSGATLERRIPLERPPTWSAPPEITGAKIWYPCADPAGSTAPGRLQDKGIDHAAGLLSPV